MMLGFSAISEAPISALVDVGGDVTVYGITGIVTIATVPLEGAIVRLYDETTGAFVSETTTDEDGIYEFASLEVGMPYTVIAYDTLGVHEYNGGRHIGVYPGDLEA